MNRGYVRCMGDEELQPYCKSCGDTEPNEKLKTWIDEYIKEEPCVKVEFAEHLNSKSMI